MIKTKLLAPLLSAALVLNTINPVTAWAAESAAETIDVNSAIANELSELADKEAGVDYVSNEGFFEADSLAEAKEVAESYGAELKSYEMGIAVVKFDKDIKEALADNLSTQGLTKTIIPDFILESYDNVSADDIARELSAADELDTEATCNEPDISKQWFHDKINTMKAWDTTTGSKAKIAILDNGFYTEHEDLPEIAGSYSVSDDSSDVPPIAADKERKFVHGTHVAGIVAAMSNNAKGGSGIAPDADIYLVRIHDGSKDGIKISGLVKGINYAIEQKVDVINMSVGAANLSSEAIDQMQNAIDNAKEAGITMVASAGNNGSSVRNYPSACEDVIAVASIDKDGSLSSFSNYGDWVDIAAPGRDIYSTIAPSKTNADIYGLSDGTSMASPMVTAVAALIYSRNPSLIEANDADAVEKVTTKLLASTDEKEYKYGDRTVFGCVDAAKAVDGEADQINSKADFCVKTSDGVVTQGGRYYISPKKTIKFTITDSNGNKISAANKKGAATYELSNTSGFTLKNNKLKCLKNVDKSATTVLKITYNGQSINIRFSVIEPVKKIGYVYDGKVRSKVTLSVSVGAAIKPTGISSLCRTDVNYYKKAKGSTSSLGNVDYLGYALIVPKKTARNCEIKTDTRGRLKEIKVNKKGTYSIKLGALGGSKKKFTIKIKAK